MNILEPAEADIVKPDEVGVWIIPGLAFTTDGNRLGYGGGWYDRLLAAASESARKIGVAHEFQIVDDLPHEPHDVRMDGIITNTLSDSHLDFTETPNGFRATLGWLHLRTEKPCHREK
jgi:5,10-methenyltetrahydrofolate synthetase